MLEKTEDRNIEEISSEEEDKQLGAPLYRIVSYPADYTIEGLYHKLQREELIVPPFQRAWVWDQVRASRLIESFIMGLPVPSIFLYKEVSQKHLIVDGQQRLLSVRSFFDGKLPDGKDFFLKGVDPKWEGRRYHDLSPEDTLRFHDSVLRAVIIEQLDPRDNTSIYHIFERLNTGGVGLNPQEIRNCIYHGPFNALMVQLNGLGPWRQCIFGLINRDSRMRDVELILRFLALADGWEQYEKPMKSFLNRFMAWHKSDTDLERLGTLFVDTVRSVSDSLGVKPFHIKRGINVAVFDSVMVAFAGRNDIPIDVAQRFEQLKTNPRYQQATASSTTDVDTVRSRIALAREVLFK